MSIAASNEPRISCRVCEKQWSKYACPRCNIRYCSLACYKVHGERCTEGFYRENLAEELQGMRASEEDKQKMLLTLQRLHMDEEAQPLGEEEEEEDEADELSEATMEKLASGAALSLEDLSPEDQARFRHSLQSGEFGRMIGPWEPWWTQGAVRQLSLGTAGTSLVRGVSSEQDMVPGVEHTDLPPPPSAPIPTLHSLTSTPPSPLLPFHLCDLLYALCFTCRVYNGEWEWDAASAAGVLTSISGVLGQGAVPASLEEVVGAALERAGGVEWQDRGGVAYGVALIADVASVLEGGRSAVVVAVEEMRRMVEAGGRDREDSRGKAGKGRGVGGGKKTQALLRKLVYFLAWANEQPSRVWEGLSRSVKACHNQQWEMVGKREKGVEGGGKGNLTRLDDVDMKGKTKPLILAVEEG